MQKQITAIIEREGEGYVSLCPELDIASQGDTVTEARDNLREAIELFFETASTGEIQTRLHKEVYTANWHNFTFLIPHPNPPPLGEGVYEKRRLCQFAVYILEC